MSDFSTHEDNGSSKRYFKFNFINKEGYPEPIYFANENSEYPNGRPYEEDKIQLLFENTPRPPQAAPFLDHTGSWIFELEKPNPNSQNQETLLKECKDTASSEVSSHATNTPLKSPGTTPVISSSASNTYSCPLPSPRLAKMQNNVTASSTAMVDETTKLSTQSVPEAPVDNTDLSHIPSTFTKVTQPDPAPPTSTPNTSNPLNAKSRTETQKRNQRRRRANARINALFRSQPSFSDIEGDTYGIHGLPVDQEEISSSVGFDSSPLSLTLGQIKTSANPTEPSNITPETYSTSTHTAITKFSNLQLSHPSGPPKLSKSQRRNRKKRSHAGPSLLERIGVLSTTQT
ncbi:hypothetical protein BDQ17DRAFT_1361487 [Cyathus striatus]|nr:hypothetical protein BDQ17DRAFT_1414201 [Cyathus striatus]KAF8999187.1 hypothetical protein BDQ17DRAFT_1361487 [Cyathus striatus]